MIDNYNGGQVDKAFLNNEVVVKHNGRNYKNGKIA